MLPEAASFKKNWQKRQRALLESGADCLYLYVHLESDTGKPFYVGIGKTKERPWVKDRSPKHKNRAKKHGCRVELVSDSDLSWETAWFWETRWIRALRNAGYDLANMTEGGEGANGAVWTDEMRAAHSVRHTQPEIVGAKSSKAIQNWKNPEIRVKYEEAFSTPEHSQIRSDAAKKAANNPENKEQRILSQKKAHNTPQAITLSRTIAFEVQNRPETKAKKKVSIKEALAKPETKKRHKEGSQRGWDNCTAEQYAARCRSMSEGRLLAKINRLEITFWGS